MYKRLGHIVSKEGSSELFIKSKSEKVYQVPYIVAFVWKKLDGETELKSINDELKQMISSEEENFDLENISEDIVEQLLPFELVEKNEEKVGLHQ